ncbi:hypothetical protein [Paenibacillus sp. PAMC21692]|uniref:hypothetical protein n=1 Tax=Paenibacillus sp. PAMC21692 TaxID=2762320 RepID=UPI00164D63EA|nr:hypothetical protein [Paenibacillus sp. PAMC21692]QNK57896.1 hypothetical protein H7F31_02710 [Paenibacillus sp. PAMC21692]
MKKHHVFITIFVFVSLLTIGRLVWLDLFKPSEQPYAVNGRLDLHGWKAASAGTITT